jgi:putative transposase
MDHDGRVNAASSSPYKGYRYPVESSATVCGCITAFLLSFHEVEEMMMARGVIVSYETIRAWWAHVRSGLRERAASPSAPAR